MTLVMLAFLSTVSALAALTPAQVLQKTASLINSAKGVDCRFSASGAQGSINGNVKASGSRFAVLTPQASTWFDGRTMWTANSSSRETTVTVPTAEEIAETNPLAYINGYQNLYNLYFSRRKEAGRYLVLLNPKKKNSGIKAVEIAVNAKTFKPERIIIRQSNDQRVTVNIRSLNLSASIPEASLTYPAASYKDYELVDLR